MVGASVASCAPRNMRRITHIPILVCSATFAGADATQMTAELGANAFLPIPYKPAALLECVHALLSGHLPQASSRVLLIEDDVAFANTATPHV